MRRHRCYHSEAPVLESGPAEAGKLQEGPRRQAVTRLSVLCISHILICDVCLVKIKGPLGCFSGS